MKEYVKIYYCRGCIYHNRDYKKIYCCGDCIHYNWEKHKCNRGANIEGKETDHFYRDCPLGIHKESDNDDFEGMDKTDLLEWLIKDVYKDDRNALIKQLESLGEDIANAEKSYFVPVVHGHWIYCKGSNNKDYRKCSVCSHTQEITGVLNYCPICGAKMDEVAE